MGLEKTVTRVTLEFSMVKQTNKQTHLVGVWNDHWHDLPSTAFCIFETHPDLDVRTKSKQSCVLALGGAGEGNPVVGSPAQKCWREWWELAQGNGENACWANKISHYRLSEVFKKTLLFWSCLSDPILILSWGYKDSLHFLVSTFSLYFRA